MGLLDDAIREHLELKRRRGADPAEVAREQREALDPVSVQPRQVELDGGTDASGLAEGPASGAERIPSTAALREDTVEPEETAEIDMNAVLDDEGISESGDRQPPSQRIHRETSEVASEMPGQEHLRFGQSAPPDHSLDK